MASSRTRTVEKIEAVAELISDGQGLTPDVAEELLVGVQGEVRSDGGGLVAASVSEWKASGSSTEPGPRTAGPAARPRCRLPCCRGWVHPGLAAAPVPWHVRRAMLPWGSAGVRVLIVLPPS